MNDRTLALAGVMQGLRLARDTAQANDVDADQLATSLATVFRIDADSAEAVYGSARQLRSGLELLRRQLHGSEQRDPMIAKMALTVLRVERQMWASDGLAQRLQDGIRDAQRQREHFGASHPTVIAALGELYASTISHLPTRVLVQGNPEQLRKESAVAQIRACLLAAVRSAVLWRQCGGSYWDWILRRRAMLEATSAWIRACENS